VITVESHDHDISPLGEKIKGGRKDTSLLLSITNKLQHYTIFIITVNALHVSGSFSAHHQELETVHPASGTASGSSKQA
jgi:hypothetical protein